MLDDAARFQIELVEIDIGGVAVVVCFARFGVFAQFVVFKGEDCAV